jgi:Clp amino terminal domain, pathogenicity island component
VFERFTRDARAVVVSTQDLCHGLGADEVRPVHLLLALTEEGSGVHGLLAAHGITTDAVATSLGIAPPTPPAPLGEDDAAALRSLGIDLDAIRAAVERQFGQGALDEPPQDETQDADRAARPGEDEDDDPWAARRRFGRSGHLRFGRGSKKVLELSLREAIRTGAREIRTEHIALGVLRADDEAVTMLLRALGVDPRVVRADLEDRGRRTA